MKKEINRKKIVTVLITICVLVLAGTGIYKCLESAKVPVYYSEKTIVLDSNDDLVLETHGAITNETYSIRFTLKENGQEYECIVLTQYTSRLLELTAPKNSITRYIIAYKDKGADTVDRVYYCNSLDNINIENNPSLTVNDINEKGYSLIYSR